MARVPADEDQPVFGRSRWRGMAANGDTVLRIARGHDRNCLFKDVRRSLKYEPDRFACTPNVVPSRTYWISPQTRPFAESGARPLDHLVGTLARFHGPSRVVVVLPPNPAVCREPCPGKAYSRGGGSPPQSSFPAPFSAATKRESRAQLGVLVRTSPCSVRAEMSAMRIYPVCLPPGPSSRPPTLKSLTAHSRVSKRHLNL